MSRIVYLGLGSNLGKSAYNLEQALKSLAAIPQTRLDGISSFYQSKPLADMDQPDYVNAVARLETSLSAEDLLDNLQKIENEFGRVRNERWGARTLDLDILVFGQEIINSKRLIVPHPGMSERDFVLIPLFELEPKLMIPGLGALSTLLEQCEIRGLQKLDND